MIMQKNFILYRLLVIGWILCGSSQLVSAAYEPTSQPDSWTYRQSYGKGTSSSPARSMSAGYQATSDMPINTGSTYRSSSTYGSAFNTTFSQDVGTDYSFRSTSRFAPIDNTPAYNAPQNAPRKAWSWSEPTDNPIGTVTNPVPVGEPFILLLMAGLYVILSCLRRRHTQA